MNILIPLVGLGKRFSDKGFELPKPLIKVRGKSILQHSVDSLQLEGNYFFVVRKYDNLEHNRMLKKVIKESKKDAVIIETSEMTRGAAESALLAEKYINNSKSLIITNCDQYVRWKQDQLNEFVCLLENKDIDGCVTTYNHIPQQNLKIGETTPFSFVELDKNQVAINFSEKKCISRHMLNGIHYWKKGSDFVFSAKKNIEQNIRYNNEFYISLTYNQLILKNKKIKTFHMSDGSFYSLGTPEDVELFEQEIK